MFATRTPQATIPEDEKNHAQDTKQFFLTVECELYHEFLPYRAAAPTNMYKLQGEKRQHRHITPHTTNQTAKDANKKELEKKALL